MGGIELHNHRASLKVGVVHYHVYFILPEGKFLHPGSWEGNWWRLGFPYELRKVLENVVSYIIQVVLDIEEFLVFVDQTID